jgi:alpha-tubulin suppressor-like RCC1 family protein
MGKRKMGQRPGKQGQAAQAASGANEANEISEAQQLAQELIASEEALAAVEAEISALEAALARCETELGAEAGAGAGACDRPLQGTNAAGVLGGGNEIFLVGDFDGVDPIITLGASYQMFWAISALGKLWIWGRSWDEGFATMALGREGYYPLPMLLQIPEPVQEVSAHHYGQQLLVLTKNGNVYSAGAGYAGELINGVDGGEPAVFAQNVMDFLGPYLHAGETIAHLYAEPEASYLLTSAGRLLFVGSADVENCALGVDTEEIYFTPIDITSNLPLSGQEQVTELISGNHYMFALTDAHHIYVWGRNDKGQTGIGAADAVGYAICPPQDLRPHLPLAPGEYIVGGSATEETSTILWTNSGTLYFFGMPHFTFMGHDGYGDEITTPFLITDGITTAVMSMTMMLVVKDDGRSLWTMGSNGYGVGTGDPEPEVEYLTNITGHVGLLPGETIVQVALTYEEEHDESTAGLLTSTGRVLTFLYGYNGTLGNGTYGEDSHAYGGFVNSPYPIDITTNLVSYGAYVTCVLFDGIPAQSYEVVNEHLIRAVVPAGRNYGSVDIEICGNAAQVLPGAYEYVAEICLNA